MASRLQNLTILSILTSSPCQFTKDFSILQVLTALAVGPNKIEPGEKIDGMMCLWDLQSLKVFCSIQKLVLKGKMGWYVPAGGAQHGAQWEELATFTSVKHLDVGDSCYLHKFSKDDSAHILELLCEEL